jgi:1-acyl-sn-glycerol-3-phosphate acyltransferase
MKAGRNVTYISTPERAKVISMRLVARAVAAGRLEVHAADTQYLPLDGPGLLIVRHYHHLFDGLALFAAIARPLHILASADWVQTKAGRWLLEWLARSARWPLILRSENLLPNTAPTLLPRSRMFSFDDVARYRRRALQESVQLLVEGRLLVVFPEGYPNIDPHFTPKPGPEDSMQFKSGFAVIVSAAEKRLGAAVPLVPAGLNYTFGDCATAYLRFGNSVYAKDFNRRVDLVRYLECQVTKLSFGVPADASGDLAG